MKYIVRKASDINTSSGITIDNPIPDKCQKREDGFWVIEIHSLEELMELKRHVGHDLIVQEHCDENALIIYDEYL